MSQKNCIEALHAEIIDHLKALNSFQVGKIDRPERASDLHMVVRKLFKATKKLVEVLSEAKS